MKLRPLHWLWIVFLLLLPGLFRLKFDVDVLNLLPANVPAVEGLKLHQKYFANANELIITVRANDPETAEGSARSITEDLRQRPDLVRGAVWQPPWMEDPALGAELVAYLWLNQPPELFGELTNRLSVESAPAVLRETQQRLATTFSPSELARLPYDPFSLMQLPGAPSTMSDREMFASADGTFRLVFVQAAYPLKTYGDCGEWLDKVKDITGSSTAKLSDVELRYTGGPAFTSEIAGSMEGDMRTSVLGTAAVVAAMFWIAHRRWRPLLWLIALLGVILLETFALAGWVLGTLNVVSAGFASILLGLADYGVVMYQEWRAHPEKSADQIRREIGPSIFLSALATGGAFFLLNLGGLPGLGQLGTLVGLGVGVAAVVMVFLYLPPLTEADAAQAESRSARPQSLAWIGTGVLLAAAVILFMRGLPPVDHSSEPLRPRDSQAYAALEEVKRNMGERGEPIWMIFRGRTESEVARQMQTSESVLQEFAGQGKLDSYELPQAVLPLPQNQQANGDPGKRIAGCYPQLMQAAVEAGFTPESMAMTKAILDRWGEGSFTPTNFASRWVLDKVIARTPEECAALGFAQPANAATQTAAQLSASLPEGVLVAGWETLGAELLSVVRGELRVVLAPVVVLVAVALWWAFRRVREIILSLLCVAAGAVTLLAVMRLARWEWNLMNLLALPLLLGAGVDYTIHMLSSLRRNGGNVAQAVRTTGRALLLAGGTTVVGFASLSWSSNAGLASLGKVCATGIGAVLLIAVYLLPSWWKAAGGARIDRPSMLYRPGLWKTGMRVMRLLPGRIALRLANFLSGAYWVLVPARRKIVINNLRPLVGERSARKCARELFREFSVKLIDLWRFESGEPVKGLFRELIGWEHFTAAHGRGKGVLLVTCHLGNWEFGGPLLIERGIKLHVVTLTEPGRGFTKLRQDFRARWGIETLVIGDDTFAVVEVIKRLQDGATVALLVDRPPHASAVTVKLFGQPFRASVAAAELARASGCAVVPVVLPRTADGYLAYVMPETKYDRAALGKRECREEFTAEIMRAFEPAIRQYAAQWYHFVPIWPDSPLPR